MLPIALKPTEEFSTFKAIGQLKFSILRPQEYFDEGDFVPNNKPQYIIDDEYIADEENGFDIYIDAL